MRYVALDVGNIRIGIASCDELELSVTPLSVVTRQGSLKKDVATIARIVVEQLAESVVIGLPLSIDGGEGAQAVKTRGFGKALASAIAVPLIYWDESLTSVEATERLIAMGYSRDKRRKLIDQWAAKILLESYLGAKQRGDFGGPGTN
jgi:putative Holliday junction resolvase